MRKLNTKVTYPTELDMSPFAAWPASSKTYGSTHHTPSRALMMLMITLIIDNTDGPCCPSIGCGASWNTRVA